jgi:hypothetical protein
MQPLHPIVLPDLADRAWRVNSRRLTLDEGRQPGFLIRVFLFLEPVKTKKWLQDLPLFFQGLPSSSPKVSNPENWSKCMC